MTSYDECYDEYYDEYYVNDNIDYLVDIVDKKELISLFHKDYNMYILSKNMTSGEIYRGRKIITEDDINKLFKNDEGYQIEVDTCNYTIDIWL